MKGSGVRFVLDIAVTDSSQAYTFISISIAASIRISIALELKEKYIA